MRVNECNRLLVLTISIGAGTDVTLRPSSSELGWARGLSRDLETDSSSNSRLNRGYRKPPSFCFSGANSWRIQELDGILPASCGHDPDSVLYGARGPVDGITVPPICLVWQGEPEQQ